MRPRRRYKKCGFVAFRGSPERDKKSFAASNDSKDKTG